MFSIIALLLASLGLYGALAYYVAQRTREIGVRIAIGAEPGRILRHVMRRSGVMVLPGLALGLVASLAGARRPGAVDRHFSPFLDLLRYASHVRTTTDSGGARIASATSVQMGVRS
jgi:ABC-type antimicrobial peptide transport system permease subunit